MDQFTIASATPEECKVIGAGLQRFNNKFIPKREGDVRLDLCIHNEAGEVIAGLRGESFGDCLHVEILWVHEEYRKHRLGSRLLSEAERIARDEHGRAQSYLDTFDFQAKDFYLKLGYGLYGELPGCPTKGHTWYYLRKDL